MPADTAVTDARPEPVPERRLPDRGDPRRFWLWMGAIALLALAVRLGYAHEYKWFQTIWGDAFYYHWQSIAITRGLGFIEPFRWHLFHGGAVQNAEHPPLYTLFLTIPNLLGFETWREHIIASCILGSFTVVTIGWLGREVIGFRGGVIAAAIAAVYANLFFNDALVISETMAGLTLALIALFVYRYWRAPTIGNAVWLGLSCGLGVLSRAEIIFYFPIVILPLVLRAGSFDLRRRLLTFGLVLVVAAAPVFPWVLRNMTTFEKPVVLSTGGDYTLRNTSCDSTYYGENVGWWDLRCLLRRDFPGDDSEKAAHYRGEALDYITSHKKRLPVVLLARVGVMWELYKPFWKLSHDVLENGRGPIEITRLALAQYYVLALLTIGGIIILRRRKIPIYPLVGLMVLATLAAMIAFGSTRYRLPGEIALVVFAGVTVDAGCGWLMRWWRSRGERSDDPPDEPAPVDAPDDERVELGVGADAAS